MILDFDVHHGDGTQAIFYEDPTVLNVDLHELENWPGTGPVTDVGEGKGKGYMINAPLPGALAGEPDTAGALPVQVQAHSAAVCAEGSGHQAALAVFDQIVAPAARRFRPDLLLVSAGFDAHYKDPLAKLTFQSPTYHALAVRIKALATELCGAPQAAHTSGAGFSWLGCRPSPMIYAPVATSYSSSSD